MEFTGERFTPDTHGDIELEHLHRYLQACEIAQGLTVLDIASGEGYGSSMLADKAKHVTGVDISEDAIRHASEKYQKPNLEYKVGNCAAIPLPDASVDMVVSFETIEHHDQHEEMMREIKRVLRPNGVLLISSPDQYNYSVVPNYNNPYHVKELTGEEFKQLVGKYFKNSKYFGQRILYGSGIFPESEAATSFNYSLNSEGIQKGVGMLQPLYWIALACDDALPHMASGVFDQPVQDMAIIKSYQREYELLKRELYKVYDSNSWRITEPLRYVSQTLKPSILRFVQRMLARSLPEKKAEPALPAYRVPVPKWDQFEALAEKKSSTESQFALVDVIIPVYRGYDDTFACILSVLKSNNTTPFELVVIDDCSPEPEISRDLERLVEMKLITLIKNDSNRGFVGTVNRGMALHADRDVILLNSDTLVFNDWLNRLRAHVKGKVATVTPFTNNGTICSYPKFCEDNPEELNIGFDRLDQLAATVNKGQSVDVPTAVGFCMYITRNSLNEVGNFDEATFGKGYGEENDFCMRVCHRGMRNVHALDVFVFHSGEVSFAGAASEYKRRAYDLLTKKHPDYDAMVHAFIAKDPSRPARIALDIARMLGRPLRPAVLFITHSWGGGLQRYVNDKAQTFQMGGQDMLVAVPVAPGSTIAQLVVPNASGQLSSTAQFDFAAPREQLKKLFAVLNIKSMELQTLAGWSSEVTSLLPKLSQEVGVPYNFMLHDYQTICPQIHLVNETGTYCGEEGPAQCAKCLAWDKGRMFRIHADLMDKDAPDIERWRAMYAPLLKQAQQVFVPSADAALRINKYVDVDMKVVPHKENPRALMQSSPEFRSGEILKVGLIGKISVHKGLDVLLRCAKDVRKRDLPLSYVVLGSTERNSSAWNKNIFVTGQYIESEIYDLLAAQNINMVFLPSVWPETYCYTLSIAMAARLPVVVFDIGAQAERLRDYDGPSLILPLDRAEDANFINEEMMRFANSLISEAESLVA